MAVLCLITLLFYCRLWIPGLALIKRDAYWVYLPMKQYMVERLSAGELPQWYPYEALGRPFIGAAITGVFHPFTLLYLLLPIPDAYRLTTLLSCLMGALGAFALGRHLNFSRWGALVAGMTFALSGYVVSITDNGAYQYSICLLPFFCLSLEKALTGNCRWVVAAALLWATVFLNGDIQTGYYYGFSGILWTALRAPGSRIKGYLAFALVAGLAALLAGIQLGPALSVFLDSNRAQAELFHRQALQWSVHPVRLLTMIAWPISSNADPLVVEHIFLGAPTFGLWAESMYFGVPALGLAVYGALGRRRDLLVLTLLGSLTLVLALGRYGGLYETFYHTVPLWSAFRFPEKFMGMVSFAVAMLAGAGFDSIRARRGRPFPWLAAAALCACAGLILRTEAAGDWAGARFGAPPDLATEVTGSVGLAFLVSAAAALGVGLVVFASVKGWIRDFICVSALLGILVADLAGANMAAYHTGPREATTFIPPLAEALRKREGELELGRFRVASVFRKRPVFPKQVQGLLGFHGAESVHLRQALYLRINEEFGIEKLRPHLPGYSPALEVLFSLPESSALARLNVAYLVGPQHRLSDPQLAQGLVAVLPAYDLALFRNPMPVTPRAYLSRTPEPAARPVEPNDLFVRPDFLAGEVDVIETSEPSLPAAASGATVMIERYAPEEVRIQVETLKPAVLLLLDSFDRGWEARLKSGVILPIMRANALARAVVVPAGHHIVTFSYRTPLLTLGILVSLVGILLCLVLLVQPHWQGSKIKETTSIATISENLRG